MRKLGPRVCVSGLPKVSLQSCFGTQTSLPVQHASLHRTEGEGSRGLLGRCGARLRCPRSQVPVSAPGLSSSLGIPPVKVSPLGARDNELFGDRGQFVITGRNCVESKLPLNTS